MRCGRRRTRKLTALHAIDQSPAMSRANPCGVYFTSCTPRTPRLIQPSAPARRLNQPERLRRREPTGRTPHGTLDARPHGGKVMRMFVGIAATLALASGVVVAAATLAQDGQQPGVWVSKDGTRTDGCRAGGRRIGRPGPGRPRGATPGDACRTRRAAGRLGAGCRSRSGQDPERCRRGRRAGRERRREGGHPEGRCHRRVRRRTGARCPSPDAPGHRDA